MKVIKTIMIVDDDPDIIFTVQEGFKDLETDFNILSAKSGKECIKLLKNNEIPDVILLDIMMPDMSGWETYDKINENQSWKNIPVVFLTARNDRIAKNAGEFLGEDYIEKPFEIENLKERIDIVINKN